MTALDEHLDANTWWPNISCGDTVTAPLRQVTDELHEHKR